MKQLILLLHNEELKKKYDVLPSDTLEISTFVKFILCIGNKFLKETF